MSLRAKHDERLPALAVIRWRGFDGMPVSSYPLPRPLAEAVARGFAASAPRESFWVDDIPWLASSAAVFRATEGARAETPLALPPAVKPPSFIAP